jgi:hypothetical protein
MLQQRVPRRRKEIDRWLLILTDDVLMCLASERK